MDTQNVVYPDNGILYRHVNDEILTQEVDEPRKRYAK